MTTSTESVQAYRDLLDHYGVETPTLHLVLGSGLGTALESMSSDLSDWAMALEVPFHSIPGIRKTTVSDHAGTYRFYRHAASERVLCAQAGRLHGYEGIPAREAVLPVMIPRMAGVKNFFLTNAAGSLTHEFPAGAVMLIRDQVNLSGQNPLVGENPVGPDQKPLGPRFPDMGQIYDPEWRAKLKPLLKKQKLQVGEGVYLGLLGPTFETPAEVELFAAWGMHVVGMSTVWEAIALRHSRAKVGGLSFVSNLGAGLTQQEIRHEEIMATSQKGARQVVSALFEFAASEFSSS